MHFVCEKAHVLAIVFGRSSAGEGSGWGCVAHFGQVQVGASAGVGTLTSVSAIKGTANNIPERNAKLNN